MIIKEIGCSDLSSMQLAQVVQPIGVAICSEHRWVVSAASFDESGTAGCPAWWCKMHVYTSGFPNDILEK
jgi:hypothetical protein